MDRLKRPGESDRDDSAARPELDRESLRRRRRRHRDRDHDGAAIAGPFDIDKAALEAMIARVLAPACSALVLSTVALTKSNPLTFRVSRLLALRPPPACTIITPDALQSVRRHRRITHPRSAGSHRMSNIAGKAYAMNAITPMRRHTAWLNRFFFWSPGRFTSFLGGF